MMPLMSDIGSGVLFFFRIIEVWRKKSVPRELMFQQIWKVTTQSALTTAIAGFFVGAIMTVQFTMELKDFGALSFLGGLATSATLREVGPMLIAFMLAGKVGAFTSAELGTMRVTEQIDALRCLGADPIQELVVPRFIAIIISSFFLLGLGLVLSVFGGAFLGDIFARVNPQEYVRHIPGVVTWPSVLTGLSKCFVFAVVLSAICTYRGYTAKGGAKGVGLSVVKTSVSTMVAIVLADWLTSFIAEIILRVSLWL